MRPAPCREPDYLPFFDLSIDDNNKMDYQFGVTEARPVCNELCSIKEWCLQTFRNELGVIAGKTLPERKGQVDHGLTDRRRRSQAVCGTDSGYFRHRTRREATCDACKAAHTAAHADRKAKQQQGDAA